MMNVSSYRAVDYTTAPQQGGLWRWTAYGLAGEMLIEGVVAGSRGEAARECCAAIDRLLGPRAYPEASPADAVLNAA